MKIQHYQKSILSWYDQFARNLPWRSPVGRVPNPYHVWLSEIMLQQTTVATVGPYFIKFIHQWPTLESLAAADLDDVFHAWQGLGYYARARNLHKCAKILAGSKFPEDLTGLQKLPGIGPYTAAAISSIAFNHPAPVMDGNIERIMARLFWVTTPLPEAKKSLYAHAAQLTPKNRSGDYAQALMDLASRICTPTSPKCCECPIQGFCKASTMEDPSAVPKKIKKVRPTRYGTVFWLKNTKGAVWIQKRPLKGLLAGLMEIPSTEWGETKIPYDNKPLLDIPWTMVTGSVTHIFTHFKLELTLVHAVSDISPTSEGLWVAPADFPKYAFPTLMKKVIHHALPK